MNKKYYTDTFSKLHPSNETVERIFDMAEKKKVRICRKTVLAIIVVLSIFVATCICANAATDGKLKEEVKNIINSKTETKLDYDYVAKRETHIDENGNKVVKTDIEAPDGTTVAGFTATSVNSSGNMSEDTRTEFYLKIVVDDNGEVKTFDIVE